MFCGEVVINISMYLCVNNKSNHYYFLYLPVELLCFCASYQIFFFFLRKEVYSVVFRCLSNKKKKVMYRDEFGYFFIELVRYSFFFFFFFEIIVAPASLSY